MPQPHDPFSPAPSDDLSDLWAEAQRAERLHPQKPVMLAGRPAPAKPAISGRELFTLEEYWKAGRGIALIHTESRTLIGNFREYTHRRVAHCRKLIRVDEPIAIHATEYVPGWEHLGEDARMRCEPQVWTTTREVLHPDLILSALGVHAPVVHVRVRLTFGGIARVELVDHTRFTSLDGRTILTLAAGVNVLETMSIEAKVELRRELSA